MSETTLHSLELAGHLIDELPRGTFLNAACEASAHCERQLAPHVHLLMQSVVAVTAPLRKYAGHMFDNSGHTFRFPRTCGHSACCNGTGLLATPFFEDAPTTPCDRRHCPDLEVLMSQWSALADSYTRTGQVGAQKFFDAFLDLQLLLPQSFIFTYVLAQVCCHELRAMI